MTEYIVNNPVSIKVINTGGKILRSPQEIRERVVRCEDCKHAYEADDAAKLECAHFLQWDYYNDQPGHWYVEPDGFCKWGKERES